MRKIKLHGLSYNNLYFGPKGQAHLHKPPVQIQAAPSAKDDPATLIAEFFIAQGNLVDADPTPQSIAADPVFLPGWPETRVTNPPTPPASSVTEPATCVKLNVAPGSSVFSHLEDLKDDGANNMNLWSDYTPTATYYLEDFTRADAVFGPSGGYQPGEPTTPGVYIWAGWGVMYYTGLFRPSRFEQYPQLGLAQMPIVYGNQIFTFDYCKTEIVFEITASGEYYLLSGKVL
jgi:hypothetical protein